METKFDRYNTTGYTDEELKTLNAAFESRAEGVTDKSTLDHIAEEILAEGEKILSI